MSTASVTLIVTRYLKGYGFGMSPNINSDVFIPYTALKDLALKKLEFGDMIETSFELDQRGPQVTRILSHTPAHEVDATRLGSRAVLVGVVKFFRKGFGFITTPSEQDIFFHRSALERSRLVAVESGTRVSFVTRRGRDGRMEVDTLQLILGDRLDKVHRESSHGSAMNGEDKASRILSRKRSRNPEFRPEVAEVAV